MLGEGNYLEMTSFIQTPEAGCNLRLLFATPSGKYFWVFLQSCLYRLNNGDLDNMKIQAPAAANRPPVSPEWSLSLYQCPDSTSSSRHSTTQGLQPQDPRSNQPLPRRLLLNAGSNMMVASVKEGHSHPSHL